LQARVHIGARPAPPLLARGHELELHHTLGAERHGDAAVAILPGFRHEDADALPELREHLGAPHHLTEMRRADLLLAFADQYEVYRQRAARGLEGHERGEE